jgi:cobyrinic acid a,c-diamide synthase
MGKRLTRFGYCEATASQPTLLADAGEWLRGHEFPTPILPLSRMRSCSAENPRWQDVVPVAGRLAGGNTYASYLHIHFAQRPTMLSRWIAAARSVL